MWTRSPPRIGRVTFDNGPVNLLDPVLNRALDTELAEHLGYEKGDPARRGSHGPFGTARQARRGSC